jgi:hypothetical protein
MDNERIVTKRSIISLIYIYEISTMRLPEFWSEVVTDANLCKAYKGTYKSIIHHFEHKKVIHKSYE